MKERYWVRLDGMRWQEATREQYIKAERAAGFYPKVGDGIATGSFSGGGIEGRTTHGEITAEKYAWDPEFLEVAGPTEGFLPKEGSLGICQIPDCSAKVVSQCKCWCSNAQCEAGHEFHYHYLADETRRVHIGKGDHASLKCCSMALKKYRIISYPNSKGQARIMGGDSLGRGPLSDFVFAEDDDRARALTLKKYGQSGDVDLFAPGGRKL